MEKINKYLFGALRIWEENGWTCFSRFTTRQDAILDARGFPLHKKAGAGMRLEFFTRGGLLSFQYEMSKANGGPNGYCGLEITKNGVPVFHIFEREHEHGGTVNYSVEKIEIPVRISVYFPNLASVKIKNAVFPDDVQTVKKETKLLALGDSITQGAVSEYANHTYINILADELGAELLNQGVGGETFFSDYIEPLTYKPDIITVAYGVNDYQIGTIDSGEIEAYFEKLIGLYPNIPVFVLLPVWWQEEGVIRHGHTLEDYRIRIKNAVFPYSNVRVLESGTFLPPLPSFYWDAVHLHPNDLGFLYYGYGVSKVIKKYLIGWDKNVKK